MNPSRIIIALLCFVLGGRAVAQDIDTELGNMTEKLATQITDQGKKKIAVIDFTDLNGGTSELGKYIAEQMNVDFVLNKRSFSVLDRANLKSILDEHKLTASGLIDPDNAKKLGQFAGVDALIMGTILPKGQNISLTAKIVTTDTAEIIGAGRAQFGADTNVQQLMSQQSAATVGGAASLDNDAPKVTKKLGDLSVGLQSLKVINGGRQYLLTLSLVNQSKKSIWAAFNGGGMSSNMHQTIRDSNGFEFLMDSYGSLGLVATMPVRDVQFYPTGSPPAPDHLNQATEIKSGDSVSVTVKFYSEEHRMASQGQCSVQLEFLLSDDFNSGNGRCTQKGFLARMEAE
jgi:TolB-like protein